MNTKERIFNILKDFAPKKYDASRISEILEYHGREVHMNKILINLARDMKNIQYEKNLQGQWFWYEVKKDEV